MGIDILDLTYQLEHKIKLARDFESQGKFLHALQIYRSILNEHSDLPDVYMSIANVYENMNGTESAVGLLNGFLENEPDDQEMRMFLSQLLMRHAMWKRAVEALNSVVPEDEPVSAFFLGYSYLMMDDLEPAKLNFLNFLSFEDQSELHHEANIYLAKIELKFKNYKSALSYAKRADAIYSNFWELNKIYAETYYNLGMYAHAVAPVEKAIRLNPSEPSPYEWAGKIYLKLEEYGKAETQFLKYIESIESASSDTYTFLAEACLKSKKPADALAYYDIAVKLDPNNENAAAGRHKASSILKNNVVSDGQS